MTEEKKDSKKCSGKKNIMFAYGFIQLGSSFVSAIALAAIAFGFCSVKKESKSNLFFILANTRSLSENDAKFTIEEICKNIKAVIASQVNEEEIIFISRGDSTLRGHNYLEPTALNSCLGPFDATFHIPAFIEGKRLTINGSHFVDKTPISQTIFATDKIFGYETSNVKNLLFQQSKSQINYEDIQNLLLSDIEILNEEENNIVF